MENTNYMAVLPQTFDERVVMYMKCKKEDLARMLAESAKYINPDGCAELQNKQSGDEGSTYTSASSLDLKDGKMETFHVDMKKGHVEISDTGAISFVEDHEKEDPWEESYDTSIEYTQKRHARIKLWKDVCDEYLEAFCDKHGYELSQLEKIYAWVGDDPGTVANIGDLFVGMDDIRYDIDHNVPETYFEKWYWKSLEVYELTKCHYMNYQSYCMGAPDSWTEERLQKARDAQKRLDEAQKAFDEEMERLKNETKF